MGDNNILSIKNLTVEYQKKGEYLRVLDRVNLDVKNGEIFALVGESGSGKSTLAEAVLRLLPASSRIKSGEIIFDDIVLNNLSEKEINEQIRGREIALVKQNPQNALNPVFTVGRQIVDILYFKSDKKIKRKELKNRAVEILNRVGISEADYRFDDYPHQFSGGMKQRVMLAMAFISNPSLLIADEPTTALDLTVEAQILKLLTRLVEEYNTTIMYISHDLGVVSGLSNRIAVMYAGRIVEVAATKELFSNPNHPYAEALLKCLPDYQGEAELNTIKGQVPDLDQRPRGCNFHPRCDYSLDLCRQQEPPFKRVGADHYSACFLNDKPERV